MMYADRFPTKVTRSPSIDYPNYRSKRRLKTIIIFVLATVCLLLAVTALIIVFAVQSSWFSDSYNQTASNFNHYGLWRLCFFTNQTCDSWFSTDGPNSVYIDQRLSQGRVGINAWQALEIVFLFLTTSTFTIAIMSLMSYKSWPHAHYYLAILTAFCVWPSVCVGISSLFVFGFSVYNVAPQPRQLDWCFYINLVAVILSLFAGILLTIYDICLKRPTKSEPDDEIIASFPDFQGYPAATGPTSYVLVRKKKKNKREQPYLYSPPLRTDQFYPNAGPSQRNPPNTEFILNPNHQMIASYQQQQRQTSPSPPAPLIPYRTRDYNYPNMPMTTPFAPSSNDWTRNGSGFANPMIRNEAQAMNDYVQRGIYRPARLNPIDRNNDQRAMFHYQTSSEGFNVLDSGEFLPPNQRSQFMGPVSPMRYQTNPAYRQ